MNEDRHDIESIIRDWRQGEGPQVELASLRRRLSRRWVLLAFETIVICGVLTLLVLAAMEASTVMGWIYWSFFAVFFVVITGCSVRLRLRALYRPDDGTEAVLDHAWRDAGVREAGGVFSLWAAPVVWLFVVVWLIADGLVQNLSLEAFLKESAFPFAFVTVVCLLGALFGALMRERGRRQRLELERLADELFEGDRSDYDEG